MTAPILTPLMKDYVLKAPSAGSVQTMNIVSPTGLGVYVSIPQGVAQVQVTWDGTSPVEVYYGPNNSWDNRRLAGTIAAGPRNTTRRLMFPVNADTDFYVVFLRANCDSTDLQYRAGVTVISQRIT